MVLVVSMLTSLFSVVSIYSILPLLNAVFSSGSTSTATTPGTPLQQTAQFSKSLSRAEEVKTWALNEFQRMFDAPTKQLTLLKICCFLILAFALKNMFTYLNGQIIFRIQTKTAKKLRDEVFSSILEMHLDYFNKNRVGNP